MGPRAARPPLTQFQRLADAAPDRVLLNCQFYLLIRAASDRHALGNSVGNGFAVHFLAHKQIHPSPDRFINSCVSNVRSTLSLSRTGSLVHCPRPTLATGLLALFFLHPLCIAHLFVSIFLSPSRVFFLNLFYNLQTSCLVFLTFVLNFKTHP